jgi:hypothetical protein
LTLSYLKYYISALNVTNGIPRFSLNEYYDFKNQKYEKSEDDENKHGNCDCLKTNPLTANSENCLYGLSQNSFNSNKKSKRSADLELNGDVDWTSSSSLNTLTNFNLDFALKGETVKTNLV